jgi:hypothetical protein
MVVAARSALLLLFRVRYGLELLNLRFVEVIRKLNHAPLSRRYHLIVLEMMMMMVVKWGSELIA